MSNIRPPLKIQIVKSPKISVAIQKKHPGKTAISVNGKIIAIGKNSVEAVKEAKKIMPNIEEKEFLISSTFPRPGNK